MAYMQLRQAGFWTNVILLLASQHNENQTDQLNVLLVVAGNIVWTMYGVSIKSVLKMNLYFA